ncbi:MAG TPA: cyclic peptide export ABC transporter [Rhodocyclaceae bacterium]|nr:cyclic peptide export ABC transporter [Rhodocyclaceae bacterium]
MRSFPAQRLLEFVDQEADYPRTRLIVFALISGLCNGLLLAVINHSAGMVGQFSASGEGQMMYLAIYGVILTLFVYTKKYTLDHAAILVEEVLCKVRMRITDKIRHTELQFIENIGHGSIYNCLAQDTVQISQSANVVFASMQAAIMLLFAMGYIAWLTFDGFIVTVGALALGVWVFGTKRKGIIRDLELASKEEVRFFNTLQHTLAGFKELKLNRKKSHDLYMHQYGIAKQVLRLKSQAGINAVFVMTFSQIFFYVLIACILFVWPFIESPAPSTIIKLTASILFIIGPLELLVGSLPLFLKADTAVNNIRELEAKLNMATKGLAVGEPPEHPRLNFQRIQFRDVYFEYADIEGGGMQFKVGPLNLQLRRGEIVFVVGGNGSGKSTLLKLLTGLYYPLNGSIEVNDEIIDQDIYPDYRELFAIIFTDFHLFDRLYGIQRFDEGRIKSLLRIMGLASKTKFRDGAFTNTQLSTGQRKRLAYINAVLEDKQIYIFDELAADQDPAFRKNFYEVLLPELRAQDKTIIAVTHDDRYFWTADRVIKMDEGHLSEEIPPPRVSQ